MTLTCLPLELLLVVLEYLPRPSLLSLRSVSRDFLRLINPRIFSEITVFTDWASHLGLIQSISTASCTITSSITTLCIGSTGRGPHERVGEEAAQAILSEHLTRSISNMQNLKSVLWTHTLCLDPSFTLALVSDGLSSTPSLKHVAILVERFTVGYPKLPPLRSFKGLSSLSLFYSVDICTSYCEQEVTPAIEASPDLTRLSIRNFCEMKFPSYVRNCTSLRKLFGDARPDLVQLKLENVPLPITDLEGLPFTRRLRRLNISTLSGSRRIDFAWAGLWSTLKANRIELSSLAVSGSEHAMDEMFNYSLSYSGLQELKIGSLRMDSQDQEDIAGRRFWTEVVPHHKESLTVLAVQCCYEGAWCYGPMAATAIPQCLSLRELDLRVCGVDSSWAHATLSRARDTDDVEFLEPLEEPSGAVENCGALILCASKIPLIKLDLDLALDPSNRSATLHRIARGQLPNNGRQASRARLERVRIKKRLETMILGMRAPASVAQRNWPSVVDVHGRLVKCPDSNESGSRWRFQGEDLPEKIPGIDSHWE